MPMLGLDRRVPGARQAHDRHQGADVRDHRPGLEGQAAGGRHGAQSPTDMVWILGRTYCTGTPEDYEAVHALQDKYTLVPLSAYGKPYTPPPGKVDPSIDMKTPVREQVNALDAAAYFALLAQLMKDNPPAAADAPMVAKMAKLGIVPGSDFDVEQARSGRAARARARAQAGAREDHGPLQDGGHARERLDVHDEDRRSTARTTSSARSSRRSGSAPTGRRTPSIRPRKWTPTASPTAAPTSTSCTSTRASCRRSKASGRSRCTTRSYFFVDNPLNRYTLEQPERAQAERRRLGRPLHPERVTRPATAKRTGFRRRRGSSS